MANDYWNPDGNPANNSAAKSSVIRSILAAIGLGFDKLPTLSGNGSKIVAVNSGGTALESVAVTGTGSVVRATSPTLVTPVLGVATATSINKVTITTPATGATLTIADGKTLTISNTMTLTGTDGLSLNMSDVVKLSTLALSSGSSLVGFIQSGTGAVAQTAQDKLRQVVNADDYSTPQQAIDTGAGTIRFSRKTYTLTSALVVSAGQRLVGEGAGKTFLLQTSATADGVYFNFATYIPGGGLSDLSIMAGASLYLTDTGSTGAGLRVTQANGNFSCDRFEVSGFATGIHVKKCFYTKFNNFQVLYAKDYGVIFATPSGGTPSGAIFLSDAKVSNFGFTGDNSASIGIMIEQSAGDHFKAIDCTSFNKGIVIKPPVGDFVTYLFMSQVLADTCTDDCITIDSSLSSITALEFLGCWGAYSTNGYGVRFIGTAIDGVQWIGGRIRENGKHGVLVEGGSNLHFVGAQIAKNSKLTTNTYDGVFIRAAVTSIQFTGGRSGNFASGLGHSQANGIQVQVGFAGSMILSGFDMSNPGAGKSGLANNSSMIINMANCLPLTAGYNPPRNKLFGYTSIGNVAAATTTYLGVNANQSSEVDTIEVVGIAGAVYRVYVATTVPPGAGETFTYTVRNNQVDTALTLSITGAVLFSAEAFGQIIFAKDDRISVKLVTSAAAVAAGHRIVIEYSA